MPWYEDEVRMLEHSAALRLNGRRPPVFYGSSTFRLWDTLARDIDPSIINLGFGGSTLEACDYFYSRLVKPLHPGSLLVYAGDNDLGDGRSVEDALASFRSLARQVASTAGPIPFGFVSVKPSPARYPILDRIRRFNEIVRAGMASIPGGYYVDVYAAMLDPSGNPRPEYFQEDGLHLNREGYRLWTRILGACRHQILTV